MANTGEVRGLVMPGIVATDDFSSKQYYAVALDTDGKLVLPTSKGQPVIGIVQSKPATGQVGEVWCVGQGGIALAAIDGTVAAGDALCADNGGKLVKATLDGQFVCAIALQAGASGATHPVLMASFYNYVAAG